VKIGAFFTPSKGKTITLHAVRKGMSEDKLKEFLEDRYPNNHVINIEQHESAKKKRKKKSSDSEGEGGSDEEAATKREPNEPKEGSKEPRPYFRSTTIKVTKKFIMILGTTDQNNEGISK
jgi:hypothetical protein